MANPIIRFKNGSGQKTNKKVSLGQSKTFPVANLLYSDTPNLPDTLSQNAMLYTTDTGKVYIGTGEGIKLINVTEGVEKKLNELKESVYSKQEIDDFIEKDVNLDGIIDRLNTYTVERANELFDQKAAEITEVAATVRKLRSDVDANLKANYTKKDEVSTMINQSIDSVRPEFATAEKANELQSAIDDTNSILGNKIDADKVYTKEEVDEIVENAIQSAVEQVLAAVTEAISNN